ncbi:MAG TPA: SMC-Scp complex subunit ScpB, partial [Kofleriaceae bacterium]|nr:SMC-Scp complex subunit ScpB [Kofleriaceae bacterium]
RIRQLTRVADVSRIEAALAKIAVDYADRGIVLSSVSGGYQFRTRSQFSSWVQQLIAGRPVRLSRAQLETLAIVAYRQPITRPEIDEIRGVDSGGTLKVLLDRQLIRALGKKEEVGRPVLYGTTKEFLDFFSLGDLRELPTLREYSELTDESRSVMKKMGLDAPDSPLPNPDTDSVAVEGASTDGSDEMAAFEAIANAAELQDELGDIGETGDIGDVLNDEPLDTPDEYAAASGRVDVMEADHDGEASRELAAGTAGNDDAEPALPSWVVPVDESEPVEIENEMPSMLMRDASEEDASDGAEVTRDGEWVAASEAVEATDDVASDMFDDEVS